MDFTKTKLDRQMEEFPFLAELCKDKAGLQIKVERLDLTLLQTKAHTLRWDLSNPENSKHLAPVYCSVNAYFFDREMKKVEEVVPFDQQRNAPFSIFRPSSWFSKEVVGETVGEALNRLGAAATQVMYVAVIIHEPEQIPDLDAHYIRPESTMALVYKVPRGKTIKSLVAELRAL